VGTIPWQGVATGALDRWRFSTGDLTAELRVDPDGMVLDYGGLFRALAYRFG
jgi:hypothetical protein